jgi:hypothetical protein
MATVTSSNEEPAATSTDFILLPTTYSAPPHSDKERSPRPARRKQQIDKERPVVPVLVRTLTIDDVDACNELEISAFPEHERCSREKVRVLALTMLIDSLYTV